jgi:CysZ protein
LWAVVPVLLNVVLLGLAVAGAIVAGPALLGLLWQNPQSGGQKVLWVLASVFTVIVLVLVGSAVLYALSGILATPFYDTLSERVERFILKDEPPRIPLSVAFRDVAVSAGHSALSLLLYLAAMVLMFSIALVPVVGSALFTVLGSVLTAVFLARDLLDGPLTRRRYSYVEKLRVLNQNRVVSAGLGSASALLTWLPLAGILLMPFAVAGGAILAAELQEAGRIRKVAAPSPMGASRRVSPPGGPSLN